MDNRWGYQTLSRSDEHTVNRIRGDNSTMNPIQSYKFAIQINNKLIGFSEVWNNPSDKSRLWLKKIDYIDLPRRGEISIHIFNKRYDIRNEGFEGARFAFDVLYNGREQVQIEDEDMKLWRWTLHNVSYLTGFIHLKLDAANSTINVG